MRALLVLLLLTMSPFVGCLATTPAATQGPAAKAAPVTSDLNVTPVIRELDFTAKDGVHVRGHVYLPPGEGKHGVVAQVSPYFYDSYVIGTDELLTLGMDFFGVKLLVGHGFAYVAANVPGTGRSTGCFSIGGADEQRDLAEFVDWLGERPWSNGNVAMMGVSYDGTTPWEAAIHNPKHLKTIVPIEGISDFYRYEYQEGAPYFLQGPTFYPRYWVDEGVGADALLGQRAPQAEPSHLCPLAATHLAESLLTTETGVYDAFWQERNLSAKFAGIQASVFYVHGLADFNVKPDNGDKLALLTGEKMEWWGQWEHNIPWDNSYRHDWSRPDWNSTIVAWFDHYLNGVDNGVPGAFAPVQVQDLDGRWRNETTWPPVGTTNLTLHFAPGKLQNGTGSGSVTIATAPLRPDDLAPFGVPVPGQAPAETQARFLSDPLPEDVRVAGVPEALLAMRVDRPGNAHPIVQLYNVSADGRLWWVDEGARGLAQRNGRTHDDAVNPNEAMRVPVDLYPSEAVFHRGERILLVVMAEDTFWYNPNGHEPQMTLDLAQCALTLPVLPADSALGVDTSTMAGANPYYRAGNLDR